jgi:hypothetical protein
MDTSHLTTEQLWDITHVTLLEHDWGEARALLDDLGLRTDNYDMLSSAQSYGMDRLTYGDYVNVIQDRIDLVNEKALQWHVPNTGE